MYTTKKNHNENGSPTNRMSINQILVERIIDHLINLNVEKKSIMKSNSFTKKLGLIISILKGTDLRVLGGE